MNIIHKRRSGTKKSGNRISWCSVGVGMNEKISGRWKECNCNDCFKEAIFGKTKSGWRTTNATRDTARRLLMIRVENKKLVY